MLQKVQNLLFRSEPIYRHYLLRKCTNRPPEPALDDSRRNRALGTREEWAEARREAVRVGLFPHPDPPKSWDSLAALSCVLANTTRDARILDAGAELYSVILPWLYLHGYRSLWGINLAFSAEVARGPIRYEPGDITRTRFDDGTFDVITCLSVIEHGVDPSDFYREASRILKPSGVLFVSTDYFDPPVDTSGLKAYGAPVRILSRTDIVRHQEVAAEHGLRPTADVDLSCRERCVHWQQFGLDYTFLNFELRKQEI